MLKIIILFLFIAQLAQAQTRFQVGINMPNASFALGESILDLPNGDLMVLGRYRLPASDYRYALIRLNEHGDTLWAKNYPNIDITSSPEIISVSSGGFLFLGVHESEGLMLVRVNDGGDIIWTKVHKGTRDVACPTAIEVGNGNFVIAGTLSYGLGTPFLVKIDGTGDLQWEKRYIASGSSPGGASLYSPQVGLYATTDGGYVIATHEVGGGFGGCNGFVIKTDSIGNVEWTSLSGGSSTDAYRAIIETNDGGYVAVGYSQNFNGVVPSALLTKFDQNGTILWVKTYSNPIAIYPTFIHELADGTIVIGGEKGLFNNINGFIMKVSANGNLLWANELGRFSGFRGSTITSDGSYIVVGCSEDSSANKNLLIAKIDSSGTLGCQNASINLTEAVQTLQNSTTYSNTSSAFNVIVNDTTILASNLSLDLEYYCDPPIISGIKELEVSNFEVNVFPNPTPNWLNIEVIKKNQAPYDLTVVNLQGHTLLKVPELHEDNYKINCEAWAQGMYILLCSQNGKIIQTKKFLVQHN